jgi:hypothetical protein
VLWFFMGFVRVADLEQDEEGFGQLKSLLVDLVYSVSQAPIWMPQGGSGPVIFVGVCDSL